MYKAKVFEKGSSSRRDNHDYDDELRGRAAHRRHETDLLPPPVTAGEKGSRSTTRLARIRSRAERREERETVAGLIESLRNGKEKGLAANSTNEGVQRSHVNAEGPGKSARIQIQGTGFRARWAQFKQRLGTCTASTELSKDGKSTAASESWDRGRGGGALTDDDDEGQEVDEIVVDNDFSSFSGAHSSDPGPGTLPSANSKASAGTTSTETRNGRDGVEGCGLYALLRWRLFPLVYHFFNTRFLHEDMEAA